MHGSSATSKWKWLVPALFLALFALALVRGAMINALGYLGFVVGGALYASGGIERSRALAYLALRCFLVGGLPLVVALGGGFFW